MYQTELAVNQECKLDTILPVFLQLRPRQAKSPHIITQAFGYCDDVFRPEQVDAKGPTQFAAKMTKARSPSSVPSSLLSSRIY